MRIDHHEAMCTNLSSSPRIICIRTPNLYNSIVSLWFQAGSRYVPKGKDGLAHLFEHLFISSNKKYPEKKIFLLEMEKAGLLYNAYTFKDLVTYYFVCSKGSEMLALEQLIEAYQTTIITQKALNHEKKVVENEERRNRASPSSYIWRLVYHSVWQKTKLASDTLGLPQAINSITLKDLENFRKRFYQPNNISVVIVTPQNLKPEKIQQILNPLGKYKSLQFSNTKFLPVKTSIHESRSIENNIHVAIAYRYNSLSFKERVIMQFIDHYLAGGSSAMFIQKLRYELGLTYWVNSRIFNTYDSGFIGFYYTVKKEEFEYSVNMIKKEIRELISKKMGTETLRNHKKPFFVKIGNILSNLHNLFYYYGRFVLSSRNHINLYKEVVDIIDELSPEDIQNVAAKHLNHENFTIATIGKL